MSNSHVNIMASGERPTTQRRMRCKNPFESPSCPEVYQQASCSAQSSELYHFISMSPEEFNKLKNNNSIRPVRIDRNTSATCLSTTSGGGEQEGHDNGLCDDLFLETPCKQVAGLNIHDDASPSHSKKSSKEKTKIKKDKTNKLLGLKSLSRLVSKIQRRNSVDGQVQDNLKRQNPDGRKTKSAILPRQSSSVPLAKHQNERQVSGAPSLHYSLEISPICKKPKKLSMRKVVASTPSLPLDRNRESTIDCRLRPKSQSNNKSEENQQPVAHESVHRDEDQKGNLVAGNGPLKNTVMVLRDVKNSIRLRLKAKRQHQEFEALTNESMATPETKLYSPFNIYTPSIKDGGKVKKETRKSKKRLQMTSVVGDENAFKVADKKTTEDLGEVNEIDVPTKRTLKSKIALRHKKHLIQANKFAFESPTGRLRETVKDVEHMQQCIEDISEAIRSRTEPASLIDN